MRAFITIASLLLVEREERIERSVTRMMAVIDLVRNIREHRIKPLKAPLKEMVVVHPDTGFLEDIAGKLKEVMREFRRPADISEEEMDDAGDGDVFMILDLRPDESLFEFGIAREVVNRVQKLRQKAGLEPTDVVEVYYEPLANERDILKRVVKSEEKYIRDALGSPLLHHTMAPDYAVIFCCEEFHGVSGLSFAAALQGLSQCLFQTPLLIYILESRNKLKICRRICYPGNISF